MVYFPASFEIILSDSLDLHQIGTLHNLKGAFSRTNELLLFYKMCSLAWILWTSYSSTFHLHVSEFLLFNFLFRYQDGLCRP